MNSLSNLQEHYTRCLQNLAMDSTFIRWSFDQSQTHALHFTILGFLTLSSLERSLNIIKCQKWGKTPHTKRWVFWDTLVINYNVRVYLVMRIEADEIVQHRWKQSWWMNFQDCPSQAFEFEWSPATRCYYTAAAIPTSLAHRMAMASHGRLAEPINDPHKYWVSLATESRPSQNLPPDFQIPQP